MGTVWTREQEEELSELFQRYKEEAGERGGGGEREEIDITLHILVHSDIVSCIMAALEGGEVKRTRKQIINQLVRQELVEDRKKLYKKAAKKKTVQLHSTLIRCGVAWFYCVVGD